MKTEGLNYREALEAYLAGDRIRDINGTEFYMVNEDSVVEYSDGKGCTDRLSFRMLPKDPPFSIVKPEPKSLSFDEAVEAVLAGKDVRILYPGYDVPQFLAFGNKVECFLRLDLAERRNWPILLQEEG